MSDLGRDPRVDRQIAALRRDYDIVTAGYGSSAYDDVEHVGLPTRLPRVPTPTPPSPGSRVVAARAGRPGVPKPAGPLGPRTLGRMATTAQILMRWNLDCLTAWGRHHFGSGRGRRAAVRRVVEGVASATAEFGARLWWRVAGAANAVRANVDLPPPRYSPALERQHWAHPRWVDWHGRLASIEADLLVVNDLPMLPLAFDLAASRPVVFDAHEHAESQNAEDPAWRRRERPVVRYIQGRYLPRVAGMMSVSPGIARRYEGATGVGSRVVTNAPGLVDLVPRPVDPQRIRVVHFGVAHPQRRLDLTIEAVGSLDERFSLDLFLVGREDRLEEVRRWAARYPRVRVLPAVAMGDLTRVANGYDVGVHLLPLPIFNHRYALPNKFFEYVQGRLAVAIGPSVEMARIAEEWGFGLVADDFTAAALARVIGEAGAQRIWECKQASHRAAQVLNAEANAAIITDLVHHALSSERRASQ
jgi:hypothetical protein